VKRLGTKQSDGNTTIFAPCSVKQIQGQLEDCASVGGAFDAMEFCELTCGQPLTVMGYWVMRQSGLVEDVGINAKKLIRYA
jgi:hypothetical protein